MTSRRPLPPQRSLSWGDVRPLREDPGKRTPGPGVLGREFPEAGGREDLRAAGSERKPACSACRLRPRGARGGSVLPSSPARREPRGLRRGWPGGAGLFIVALVKSDPWKGAGVPADRGLSAVCPGASPLSRRDWGLRPARLPRVRTARNPRAAAGAGRRDPASPGGRRSAGTPAAQRTYHRGRARLAHRPPGPRRCLQPFRPTAPSTPSVTMSARSLGRAEWGVCNEFLLSGSSLAPAHFQNIFQKMTKTLHLCHKTHCL